jgi:hypothetical protein
VIAFAAMGVLGAVAVGLAWELARSRRAHAAEAARLQGELAVLRERLAGAERSAAGAEAALLLHEHIGEEELVQGSERGPAETPAPRGGRTLH